ncbi:histamine H2 receptor-like [Acropora millepora]|uniref:histamine H2 receptor-like n=1 Tax=Acropora millepora TaxID=45264 RepID=UPI001CF55326|nr:histamine H2 receptor-like [Acropora millepora]XP_029185106.2 histamine H2 receptor-like [Acropora millepora]XP_029185112.2 histamine H2 receptor-like [Acropora millepora]XP_029185119.2 histamine H2 receptor-like [Acropora millepora]
MATNFNHKMNESRNSSTLQDPNSQANPSFITVFLVITIILAVFGNTLVCLACVFSKRLQSFTSGFIISLAVTDILVGLISMPIYLSVNLFGKPNMKDSPGIYKAWLCIDIVCGTASIMNLVFISLDRLLAVTYPLRYQTIVRQNRIAIAIAFIWVYSVTIASLNLLGWRGYPLLVSLASFFVPLLIMVIAYSRIFLVALTHARSIRRIQATDQLACNRREALNFQRNIKAARTLSIVIGAFVVCWCPFFVVTLLYFYGKTIKIHPDVLATNKWLHYGNSALNPIIYSCLNKNFRAAFKDVFRMMVKRRITADENSTVIHSRAFSMTETNHR